MIKFTLSHFNGDSKSLEFPAFGMTENVTPTLAEIPEGFEVELSANESIAVTMISIRQILSRISHQLDAAMPNR